MSEKGDSVIYRHDVEICESSVYNESIKSETANTKESLLLSPEKYTSANHKAILTNVRETNTEDVNLTDLHLPPTMKSTSDPGSPFSNNQISLPHSFSLPISKIYPKSIANTMELTISSTTIPSIISSVSLSQVPNGDIVIGDLPNVEEWLKSRSDSLSSLDFDTEMKNSEMDVSDFLTPKSSTNVLNNSTANSNIAIDQSNNLCNDIEVYNNESGPTSSGFMQTPNSYAYESDSSLSSNYDVLKGNKTNLNNNLKKIDNLVHIEKGLFEEMLLTDSLKKNFKLKDSMIDDKGLFEELLMPGVQEWLLTVSSDKKDSISASPIDSISVPQSPNVLAMNDQDETSNKNTFDEYDLIDRNINTFKLMTPQEIENMPSRSLGFDEGQFKEEMEDEQLGNLPFHSCENKELTDLPSGSNTDIDHKLLNILAMDASNDTLDNNNFSENILDTIEPENKNIDISNENFICPIDSQKVDSDSMSQNNLNTNKISKDSSNLSSGNLKIIKIGQESIGQDFSDLKDKDLPDKKTINYICPDSSNTIKPLLSNIKIITKNNLNNTSLGHEAMNKKNKSLSIGVVKLKKLSSSKQPGQTNVGEKKSGTITLPRILIKPTTVQSQGTSVVPITEAEDNVINSSNLTNVVKQASGTVLSVQNMAGLAKVNISVDNKANTTNVSIISSNKEHTVFKINTSDLIRAVSSIKEAYLEPLGLKKQQLIETANAANKLLNVHSHFSHLKKLKEDGCFKGAQNFEINQYIQEVKPPVSRAHTTLSNMGHIIATTKVSENLKSKNYSKIDSITVSNGIQPRKFDEKSSQIKKLIIEKPRGHGENVGISLLPGAPPTMVSVPSVLDALSGPTTSKVNIAQVLADCELTAIEEKNETKEGQPDSTSDEKTNNALIQLGINPNSFTPNIGPKGNKRWQCPIASCTKHFPKLSYLKVHILNHKGIRPYKCSYENCDWSFYTSYKLKRHLETHLKRRDFVCTEPDCSRRFTTIYNLNTHMTLHKRPKAWVCSLLSCGKAFHTRRELEAHMKLHTDVKPPYKCSMEGCCKAYFTPNSLASHMRSHHKEEDLRCQWVGCEKRFDKPCRLRAHMRVHTGQRPYVCTYEGCNWRFQCASKLSRHQRKHTNDRKYSCPICKKAFLRSEHLKGHLLTHTGVRNFQCPIANCEAKFTAKSSLYVHLKKHKTQRNDVKLPCPIDACEKSYNSKLNLQQHLLKNHTQIFSSDASHLDYITLVSDKDLNDQMLPQPLSSLSSFSLQNPPSIEGEPPDAEVSSLLEKKSTTVSNATSELSDLILATNTRESSLPLSSHFQQSIIQDDGISCALYEDPLINQDLISDPSSDPQSTINFRDLE